MENVDKPLHFICIGPQVFPERGETQDLIEKYRKILSKPAGSRGLLHFSEGGTCFVDINTPGVVLRIFTHAEFIQQQQQQRQTNSPILRKV